MFRLSMKNVWARKGRLLLTALAIIAGTAFLSGVFVFSDTIKGTFDKLFASAYAKTDAYVRSTNKIDSDFGDATRQRIPESLVITVQGVPGVQSATGDVQGFAQMTTPAGKKLGNGQAPDFGGVFTASDTTPWAIDTGRVAGAANEVVIDKASAKRADVKLGDPVVITAKAGVQTFTVVGIAKFAGSDSSAGASWALFDLSTAQNFVAQAPDAVDAILVAGKDGVSQTELADRIEQAIGKSDVETLTGKQITAENQSEIEKGLSFFKTVLSIFALISLFVGSFIIFNVFSISAAQRQRENALLRAIGASSGQVTRSLLVEGLMVGVVGSLLGFGGGVALAIGITKLLDALGFGLAGSSLVVKPDAFIVSFIAGVVVSLLCAIVPALRAGRVPPLAAMREISVDNTDVSRSRLVLGSVFLVGAAAAIVGGLAGTTILLAVGVIALFIALIALGPLLAGPIARLLTPVLTKIRGVVGAVAGRNASRSPKRIALTAGALGVGLSLLVGVATLGSSIKASIRETVGKQFVGEYTVTGDGGNGNGVLPLDLATKVGDLPEVAGATGVGAARLQITSDGKNVGKGVALVDPTSAAKTVKLTFVSGGWDSLTADGLLVSKQKADDEGLKQGSPLTVTFVDKTTKTVTVEGIFSDKGAGVLTGNYIADRSLVASSGVDLFDIQVFIARAPGVTDAAATTAVKAVVKGYPTAKFQTRAQFIDDQTAQVDTLLNVIYALLAMSIFIAILGIVITLLLSVYERRRELGLMRAIGTTRAQVRGSVRWEAVITAIVGTVMGVSLGIALGWVVVKALSDQGLNTFELPVSSIVIFAVAAIVLAVGAAWWPARRAAKADILSAIATT